MANRYVCPACGRLQGRGDGFCRECGTQLLLARYCDTCGVLAAHAGEFCRECGARLPLLPSEPSEPAELSTTAKAPPAAQPPEPATPAWLREPEPRPEPDKSRSTNKRKRPAENGAAERQRAKPPVPTPSSTAPSPPSGKASLTTGKPLARRPAAPAVPFREAGPPVPSSNPASTALAIAGGIAGVSGLLLAAVNLPLALILLVMMFVLAGRQTRELAAGVLDRIVDWVWEDPVLRRRLLGE